MPGMVAVSGSIAAILIAMTATTTNIQQLDDLTHHVYERIMKAILSSPFIFNIIV